MDLSFAFASLKFLFLNQWEVYGMIFFSVSNCFDLLFVFIISFFKEKSCLVGYKCFLVKWDDHLVRECLLCFEIVLKHSNFKIVKIIILDLSGGYCCLSIHIIFDYLTMFWHF